MGDIGDTFNAWREQDKERKENSDAIEPWESGMIASASDGWEKHTRYHWSRKLNGKPLHFWPSTGKFMYEEKVMFGDVMGFYNKRVEAKPCGHK